MASKHTLEREAIRHPSSVARQDQAAYRGPWKSHNLDMDPGTHPSSNAHREHGLIVLGLPVAPESVQVTNQMFDHRRDVAIAVAREHVHHTGDVVDRLIGSMT